MNIKRLYITLLIGFISITLHAIEFDCKINYANGKYNGKTEEEMIKLNTEKFGNDTWATLWEAKKEELSKALIFAFCKKGMYYQHLRAGSNKEESPYKIEINIISIDPDGEVEAHILAYLNNSATGELEIYFDAPLSANGGKDATYTKLNTQGFAKLGTDLAVELGKQLANHQRATEKREKEDAKEAEREAKDAKHYVDNPTNPDDILITMVKTDVEDAKPLYPIKIERLIKTSEGETRLQCFNDIKVKASRYGATMVLIEEVRRTGEKLIVRAYSYKN